jgi:predicted transcriptional regulator
MPQPRKTLKLAEIYLQKHGETRAGALADALGVTAGTLTSAIKPAVLEGTVAKRTEGRSVFYSTGNGIPTSPRLLEEHEERSFNASLWADGDLVLYGVTINDDGESVTIGRQNVTLIRRLLTGSAS